MLKNIIEGLLMAADEPLKINDLAATLNADNQFCEVEDIKQAIAALIEDYKDRGIQLQEVARGFRFQVAANLAPWVSKLYAEKPPRYSRALLETLALIAYKQPITRAEIEEIRGVSGSYNIMKTLMEQEWVKIAGYKNVPGKPALLVTTSKFLDYFNLKTLEELPSLADADMVESEPEAAASDSMSTDNVEIPVNLDTGNIAKTEGLPQEAAAVIETEENPAGVTITVTEEEDSNFQQDAMVAESQDEEDNL